jgi:hypothetical protein
LLTQWQLFVRSRRFNFKRGSIVMQIFKLEGSGHYAAAVLSGELVVDDDGSTFLDTDGANADPDREAARLVPWVGRDGRRGAVLLTRSSKVTVDGGRALPLTALVQGSEIRIGRTSLFFTDETPLEVVPFAPAMTGRQQECVRCHGPIAPGDPVVHCPCCGIVYMAQPDKSPNCWDFGPCLGCGRDPNLTFAWHPDGILEPER